MVNEKLIHLAPCEEKFAETLVGHMLQVRPWVNDKSVVHHYIYIDSAFDYSCDERDRPCVQDRATGVAPKAAARLATFSSTPAPLGTPERSATS